MLLLLLLALLVSHSVSLLNVGGVYPNPRGGHCGCLFDDKLYVMVGHDGTQYKSDVHCLDNIYETSVLLQLFFLSFFLSFFLFTLFFLSRE
jgi:hypothetical protein